MSRSRNYVFTVNNYSDDDIRDLGDLKCKYLLYGKEVAPTTGTPHLQGMVTFSTLKTLSQVKADLPSGAHIEETKHVSASVIYCKKEGDYVERGSPPVDKASQGKLETDRWEVARSSAKSGDLDSIPADIYLRYYRTLKEIKKDSMVRPASISELNNEWFYGPSGTGKTRHAHTLYPGAYLKGLNQWWDGYQGEETVIIDDFDKYNIALSGDLKRWLDHYPFMAQTKGGMLLIRPKKFIITSNYRLEDIWQDEETLEPLRRRLKVTLFDKHEFNPLANPLLRFDEFSNF